MEKLKEIVLSPSRVAAVLTAVGAFSAAQFGTTNDWSEVDVASVVIAIAVAGHTWLKGRSAWETTQQVTGAGKTGRK